MIEKRREKGKNIIWQPSVWEWLSRNYNFIQLFSHVVSFFALFGTLWQSVRIILRRMAMCDCFEQCTWLELISGSLISQLKFPTLFDWLQMIEVDYFPYKLLNIKISANCNRINWFHWKFCYFQFVSPDTG